MKSISIQLTNSESIIIL